MSKTKFYQVHIKVYKMVEFQFIVIIRIQLYLFLRIVYSVNSVDLNSNSAIELQFKRHSSILKGVQPCVSTLDDERKGDMFHRKSRRKIDRQGE